MHTIFSRLAFGWLSLAGLLHFVADVASPFLKKQRLPGPETSLYYGLNSAHALSQLLFGLLGLLVLGKGVDLLGAWPGIALCLVAGAAWLAFDMTFLEYWQPKFATAIFCALIVAALFTRN